MTVLKSDIFDSGKGKGKVINIHPLLARPLLGVLLDES